MLGAAIAQWFCLHLPSRCPGFESQARHLCFHQIIKMCNVEKTKINQKEAVMDPFKNNVGLVNPFLNDFVRISQWTFSQLLKWQEKMAMVKFQVCTC